MTHPLDHHRAAPPMSPLTFADILDGAFALLRGDLRRLLVLTFAAVVPLQLLGAYLQRDQIGVGFLSALNDPFFAEALIQTGSGNPSATLLIGLLGPALVLPVVSGAIALLGVSRMLGHPMSAQDATRTAVRRAGALIGMWWLHLLLIAAPAVPALLVALIGLAAGFGAFTSFLLFLTVPVGVVGALLVVPLLVAATPALMAEGITAPAALRRSIDLARPRYGAVLGTTVGTALVLMAVAGVLGAIPAAIGYGAGGGYAWVLVAVSNVISQGVMVPASVLVATLIYLDLRMRVEGLDLSLRARRLAAAATPPRPGAG